MIVVAAAVAVVSLVSTPDEAAAATTLVASDCRKCVATYSEWDELFILSAISRIAGPRASKIALALSKGGGGTFVVTGTVSSVVTAREARVGPVPAPIDDDDEEEEEDDTPLLAVEKGSKRPKGSSRAVACSCC